MRHIGRPRVLFFLAAAVFHVAASAADSVPLRFIDGLPFASVKVGSVTSSMMIDSGGSLGISLPEATLSKAGSVTMLDRKTKFKDLQGKVYEVQDLLARQVVVGNTSLDAVEGRVHVQWGGAPEGPEAELTRARRTGAIGLGAFGKRPLMFDYRLGTLTMFGPGEGPQAGQQGWRALRLDYGKEGPNITLLVNGKPLKFVLDTGTPVNLVNQDSLVPVSAHAACQQATGKPGCDSREIGLVQDSSGNALDNFSAERAPLQGAPFDGLLGGPFFRQYRVLFDLSAHRLLISPYETTAPMPSGGAVRR